MPYRRGVGGAWHEKGVRDIFIAEPPREYSAGNSRTLTRTFDQDYAIDRILSTHTGGLDLDFTTNAVDNITAVTTGGDGNVFDYDDLNRLTAVREPNQTLIQGFAYDDTGNRLSKQVGGSTQAYTYAGTNHRLATVAGASRTYSAAGSTLTAGTKAYVYNDAGRMIETLTGGVRQRQYQYNARGERVRAYKDTTIPQTLTVFDEAGHVLGEYNETAARIREYVWLDDLPIAVITGTTGTVAYLESDHLGTPRAAIDPASNTAIWKWNLLDDAFGETAALTDPDGNSVQFNVPLRFPGQIADADTGLNYNYFRDYEAGTGRYVESDPIGLAGGTATFSYGAQSPIRRVDPLGLFDVTAEQICVSGPCYWQYKFNFQDNCAFEIASAFGPQIGRRIVVPIIGGAIGAAGRMSPAPTGASDLPLLNSRLDSARCECVSYDSQLRTAFERAYGAPYANGTPVSGPAANAGLISMMGQMRNPRKPCPSTADRCANASKFYDWEKILETARDRGTTHACRVLGVCE